MKDDGSVRSAQAVKQVKLDEMTVEIKCTRWTLNFVYEASQLGERCCGSLIILICRSVCRQLVEFGGRARRSSAGNRIDQ